MAYQPSQITTKMHVCTSITSDEVEKAMLEITEILEKYGREGGAS